MTTARLALVLALLATPALAGTRGGHHLAFGLAPHHPINAWQGSHHLKLR